MAKSLGARAGEIADRIHTSAPARLARKLYFGKDEIPKPREYPPQAHRWWLGGPASDATPSKDVQLPRASRDVNLPNERKVAKSSSVAAPRALTKGRR